MKCARLAFGLGVVLSISALGFGNGNERPWKEYAFPADGFAITLPHAPEPHTAVAFPDATAYTVELPGLEDCKMVLRVTRRPRDYSIFVRALRDGILRGKDRDTDAASVKDLSTDGHPGFEYLRKVNARYTSLDRYYCVDGRLYAFSTGWLSAFPLPVAAKRILDSFRFLGSDEHP